MVLPAALVSMSWLECQSGFRHCGIHVITAVRVFLEVVYSLSSWFSIGMAGGELNPTCTN
jgi:tRNA(Phe) wybutosine-synthesizing methylase Tyw3